MTPAAAIVNDLTKRLTQPQDLEGAIEIIKRIPGWSNLTHFMFFRSVLAKMPEARILVCGVYHGLDLTLIRSVAKPKRLVGVDLFSDQPCLDWKPEDKGKTWQQAHRCAPPSIEAARANCPDAEIHQANSIDFLKAHAGEFDFIFLDTSHDDETLDAEITAVLAASRQPTLLAGDDYDGIPGTDWGVARMCEKHLPRHIPLFRRIWLADLA